MSVKPRPQSGDVLVLIGTRKGAFMFYSDADRAEWHMSGPHWPGSDIFHVVYDARRDGCLYVVDNNPIFGSQIHRSEDFGETWHDSSNGPSIRSTDAFTVNRIWQIVPGPSDEPDLMYAGGDPACLFRSEDGGDTWSEVESITSHPTREFWFPGFGGMCLHSIVVDPHTVGRMWIGVSAAGVFGTDDGGQNWHPKNKGVRADFLPERFPEFGQCPHKLDAHRIDGETLYQQNHCGVYRSDNGGEDWIDISDGLPSRFGLAMAIHPTDPDTIYVLPEDRAVGDELGGGMRYVTDAKMRVFRTRNRGADWEPLTTGLPQQNAYLHAMRDGLATDMMQPCGVYVGTSTGQIYYSRDEGETWDMLADLLPPINSVETAVVI